MQCTLALQSDRQAQDASSGASSFYGPPGKSAAHFFVCGESSSISRRYSQLNRSTKTCFLDHVIPGSIGRQLSAKAWTFWRIVWLDSLMRCFLSVATNEV